MSAEMMLQAAGSDLALSLLTPEAALGDPDLLAAWRARLGDVHRTNRLYASPEWFENRWRAFPEAEMRLGVLRHGTGELLGFCPLVIKPEFVKFSIGRRVFAVTRLRTAHILGSEPLLPRSPALYRRLFDGIFEDLPQVQSIFSPFIPTESFAWDYLRGEGSRSRRYFSYLSRLQESKWHLIDLREGFDQYLGAMTAKTRRNLRRQVRVLREHGGGRLECRHVEAEDQVEAFLEAAERVRARSWQGQKLTKWNYAGEPALGGPELKGLARAKVLRAYLLECGGEPCAYIVGYQFDGVFTGKETRFDESLGRLSPGTVLLYLVLEDLFARDRPELLDFCAGIEPYKERFGNQTAKNGALFLFRRNLANRLRHMSLVTFYSGVRLAKRLLKVERLSGILRG